MLVLSRKCQQEVRINGTIRVFVLEARNGRVTLGIEAPPEMDIYRPEVLVRQEAGPTAEEGAKTPT